MVAIEAMSRATPVIASQTGGIPEIIDDGVNGLLFWPGDYENLADKMEALLDEYPLVERIRVNGHRRVMEAFDGTISLRKFQEIITNECEKFSGYTKSHHRIINTLELFAVNDDGVCDKFYTNKLREAIRIYISSSRIGLFLFRIITKTKLGMNIKQRFLRLIEKHGDT
jgi:hypothetical protein